MEMFITESLNSGQSGPRFASTNSIPLSVERSGMSLPPTVVFREQKGRRHSVLDDLRARRDSLFQRARRGSIFEEKENKVQKEPKEQKEKRRSSEGNRRGSVFYVTDDLLVENQEILNEEKAIKKGRRKSWHPLAQKPPKSDRKRKKGFTGVPSEVGSSEALYGGRQKRLSWWNIFVPDSVSRSRRMSQQDVSHTRSTENLSSTSFFRNKSRSVDHGLAMPFNLELLRDKVEDRLEAVDESSRNAELEDAQRQKRVPMRRSQPPNTHAYAVGNTDTLTSIAARFDTTPSELSKLNRLGSTFVYPGQRLWVPSKDDGSSCSSGGNQEAGPSYDHDLDLHDDLPPEERELLDNLRPVSPKLGRKNREKDSLYRGDAAMAEDGQPGKEKFLKIHVRHITDGQGVVSGVLLVTPNAVMFDPNVSDPLVIEHGAESYGVIAPMEFIVNSAIYHDIAHMRVSHTEERGGEKKPEIYYMEKPSADIKSLSPGKNENFTELAGEDNESDEGTSGVKEMEKEKEYEKEKDDEEEKEKEKEIKKEKENEKEKDEIKEKELAKEKESTMNNVEERKRSMLDHHWAVPSKDRLSFSVDEDQQDSINLDKTDSSKPNGISEGSEGYLVKQSCYDSGIDIREPYPPIPLVQPIPSKKVYSDADIVLSSDWVPPITIVPTNVCSNPMDAVGGFNGRKKTNSVSFSLDNNTEELEKIQERKEEEKPESRKNKMIKRLSYPLYWMEGLTGDNKEDEKSEKLTSQPNSADSHHSSVFSKVFSRRSSVGTFIRQQPLNSSGSSSTDSNRGQKQAPRKLDYRSMVSMDDMPELFASIDKLIPRPARSCEDPPMYLRLRTGKPKDRKIPRSTPIMSYGKKRLRPEYWFSIPRNRVDDLFRFIQAWVPALYGELDEDYWNERGYILLETETDMVPETPPVEENNEIVSEPVEEGKSRPDITELTRESWEVLSMSEDLRRALYASSAISLDIDVIVPDLVGTTEILSDEHRENLCRHLPARAEGYLWTLVFSTSQHGFSLNSLYRKMADVESPILLVIEDTAGNVFGAFTSCSLRVSDLFYGNGESLLFRFTPRFQVFNWTGDNLYFIKGNNESLVIGAGDGKFGLWLDGDLYQGRTQPCSTYGNEPLAPQEDFVVKTLECWAFI